MYSNPAPGEVANSVAPLTIVRGIAGAMGGAVCGYFAFYLLLQQSLYAMILPGALVGFCAGLAMQREYRPVGVAAAALALVLGLGLEWQFVPFIADPSLGYFLTHLHQVVPMHLVMIALGAFFAYWFGVGRRRS